MRIFQQAFGTGVAVLTVGDGRLQYLSGEELTFWQNAGVRRDTFNERGWDLMLTKFTNSQQFARTA